MGGNGLIVSFEGIMVMPMRLGRLQRQSRRAFRLASHRKCPLRARLLVLGETDASLSDLVPPPS